MLPSAYGVATYTKDGRMLPDSLVVIDDERGMQDLQARLPPAAAERAARAIFEAREPLLLCTGFPVGGRPETDGPPGTIALARALKAIGREPIVVSWPDVIDAMDFGLADISTRKIPQGCAPPRRPRQSRHHRGLRSDCRRFVSEHG